jgi:hypothetical protein
MTMIMSMQMTFGPFWDYKLSLLFSPWIIEEKWQFALAWVAVVLAVILYHSLHYVIFSIEAAMRYSYSVVRDSDGGDIEMNVKRTNEPSLLFGSFDASRSLSGAWKMRLIHAILGGASYALALLLMLVAMTYNCLLFIALIVGYIIGDLIFFRLSGSSPDSGCH